MKLVIFILFFILFTQSIGLAITGNVVYTKDGVPAFIAQTDNGFAIMEWEAGCMPDKGDKLVGDYESYGYREIYNLTQDGDLKVHVTDYGLSKADAMEKYFEQAQ